MRKLLAVLAVVSFLAAPLAALSQDGEGRVRLRDRIEAWNLTQDWVGDGQYSVVFFDEEAFEDIFNEEYMGMVRFGLGWYPAENLSINWYTCGLYDTGRALGSYSGKRSDEDVELYVVPLQLNVRYRFKYLDNQLFVPSVYIGGDYWYFQEVNDESDNVVGDKLGWHWGADLGILLDGIDPGAAHRMAMDWNIDDTLLVLGYEQLIVGEWEDGLEFSGAAYSLGIRFETEGVRD